MPKYIDADALIKRIFPCDVVDKKCYTINAKAIYEEIQKAPTADVAEVVRCKDCIHRSVPTRCSLWMGTSGDTNYFREHGDDFYCAFGERTPQKYEK